VAGTSSEANEVYDTLISSINAVGVDGAKLKVPLVMSETTQCSATLDFTIDSLLDRSFMRFVNTRVKREATTGQAKGTLSPRAIELEIGYDVKDKAVIENKITLAPKKLVIAAREGSPQEARRYLLSSPFDSDTHFRVFGDLEKAIVGSGEQVSS
jgi:hypothetical protein